MPPAAVCIVLHQQGCSSITRCAKRVPPCASVASLPWPPSKLLHVHAQADRQVWAAMHAMPACLSCPGAGHGRAKALHAGYALIAASAAC